MAKGTSGTRACGFCSVNNHDHCIVVIRNGNGTPWRCGCGCGESVNGVKCVDCGNRNIEEVDARLSLCSDRQACADTLETRRRNSPVHQFITESHTRLKEKKMSETTTKTREKVVKVGKCRCCAGETKGGEFLPGHDARFVGQLAVQVVGGSASRDDAFEKLEGLPKLQAKLDARLAREAREAEAKAAKAAAKAEAAANKQGETNSTDATPSEGDAGDNPGGDRDLVEGGDADATAEYNEAVRDLQS